MLSSQIESPSLGKGVPPPDILEAAAKRNGKNCGCPAITKSCEYFDGMQGTHNGIAAKLASQKLVSVPIRKHIRLGAR
mgnify:CR=1 FL=1